MDKQDTPNKRLARVLRLLADVADSQEFPFNCQAYRDATHWLSINDTEAAEVAATEAASLAGVPLDGWVPVDYARKNGLPDENEAVIVTALFDGKRVVLPGWLLEDDDSDHGHEGYVCDFFDAPISGDRIENVIAWTRKLPEPYRPEEKTDEQR